MANNVYFSDTACEAGLDAVAALLNSGKLEIYSGAQPTDANTAVGSQTKLATLTFSATAFPGSSSSGTPRKASCAANSITSDTNAAATGTAAWFRCYESDGTTVILDGTVDSSGADLNLSTTSIIAGGTVEVTGFTLSLPEH